MIKGADFSEFDGIINWPQYRASGRTFAWLRSSCGNFKPDALFQANWTAAKKYSVKVGAYHVFHPDEDPGLQAAAFCDLVKGSDLPPVLDLEWIPTATGERWATVPMEERENKVMEWLLMVEGLYRRPWNYSSKAFIEEKFPPNHKLGAYNLWLCHYKPKLAAADLPHGWTDWAAWQTTDSGIIQGVPDKCDLNLLKEECL